LLEGLVVSAAGYGAILLALSWLSRFNGTPGEPTADRLPPPPPLPSSLLPRRILLDLGVVAVLLIAAAVPLIAGSRDVSLARNLERLPGTLGSWRLASVESSTKDAAGITENLVGAYPTSAGVRTFAGVDDEIALLYENSSPVRLRLYVGYYRRQQEGRELAGDAGQVLATASTPVVLTVGSDTVRAREVVRATDGVQRGVLYWFDIDGRVVSDRYLAKAYTLWNGLTRQRTNGAVVMISWESTTTAPDARAEAIAFARELLPLLRNYFAG
jgi:EpsI family protein